VWRDEAFKCELGDLFEAFNSTSDGAIEIVEVTAIINPQREAALEAQFVQWEERMSKGDAFIAGWNELGTADRAKQHVFEELSKRRHDSGVLVSAGLVDSSVVPSTYSICSNGFAILSKTGDGYFARGVYATLHSAYM
jgi:hypothetical protein